MRTKNVLYTALCLVSLALGVPTGAAPASTAAALNIPSQSLRDALTALGQQTGLQVVYTVEEVSAGMMAPAVSGKLTPQAALTQLLANSGLAFTFVNERTVAIQRAGSAGAAVEESRQSAQVRVANSEGEAGQEKNGGGLLAGSAEPVKLEEVVVTAQKRKEILKDVPISISVLSGDKLDKSTFSGVMETLRTVPGVTLLPNGGVGGGTSITIRGVGSGGIDNGSAPTGFYLDGVPVSLIRHAITPDQNPFDLERIEVLRGPQGTLYGAGSISGLVRVLTKDPDLNRFELKARSTVSQTDEAGSINYRGDAAVNVPLIEDKLAARAVIGYDGAAGWIDTRAKEDSNAAHARNYRLKLKAQPSDALSIGLSAWVDRNGKGALDLSDDNAHRYSAVLPEPFTENFDAYNVKVGYDADRFSLQSSTSYFNYKSISRIDYTTNPLLSLGTDVVTSTVTGRSFSQEIVLNAASSSIWKWTVGTFYRDLDSGLLQVWPGVLTLPLAYDENSKSEAVFGQFGRRFLNERFEWTLGARYFEDKIHHEQDPRAVAAGQAQYRREGQYHAATPRAVLTWYPSNAVTTYVSYSQGFRSGVPAAYTVTQSTVEFPGAKPDKLNSYELGTKMELWNRRLSLDAAVYHLKWNDVQQTLGTIFQGSPVTALTNGQSASGNGIDFTVTGRPTEGLELGLNGGWNNLEMDADVFNSTHTTLKFAKGDRLGGSPELTSTAFINYNRPLGARGYNGGLSISASYVSKLYARTYRTGTRDYTTVSGDDQVIGRASFTLDSPLGWSAALFIDNFTNEYGRTNPIAFNSFTADANPHPRPRTVGVQFEYRYGSH